MGRGILRGVDGDENLIFNFIALSVSLYDLWCPSSIDNLANTAMDTKWAQS